MSEYEAGRELDALIAERVFGWEWRRTRSSRRPALKLLVSPDANDNWQPLQGDEDRAADWYYFTPRYSTDTAAAWEVVEQLMASRPTLGRVSVDWVRAREGAAPFAMARVWAHTDDDAQSPYVVEGGLAETAPLAICRAAIRVVEGDA